MIIALYIRVSSEEQAQHGLSLDVQEAALRRWAEDHHHTVAGIYRDEGVSARKPYTKRPELQRLLSELDRKHIQLIAFTKLDRWFRSVKDYYSVQDILDRHHVEWATIWEDYETSTAAGRLKVNIMLSVAQDEADRTSERIKQVQARQVEQGKPITGHQPFGYMVKDHKVVKNPDASPILEDAISHYMLRQNMSELTRYLNSKYHLAHAKTVYRRWLSQEMICGCYRGNPDYCEPYISRAEYDHLQAVLTHNVRKARTSHVYIFGGLIRCPYCGCLMTGYYTYNGYKSMSLPTHYYRCRGRIERTCDAPAKTVRESKLEVALLDKIESYFEDYRIEWEEDKRKRMTEKPDKYIAQLDRLKELYILGDVSREDYDKRKASLTAKITALSEVIDEDKESRMGSLADTLSGDFREAYGLLDDKHKQMFWRGILKEIKLDKDMKLTGVEFL